MLLVLQDDEEEPEEEPLPQPPPLKRVIMLSAPEWLYLTLGAVGAAVSGIIMPAFAFVFAQVLGVVIRAVRVDDALDR